MNLGSDLKGFNRESARIMLSGEFAACYTGPAARRATANSNNTWPNVRFNVARMEHCGGFCPL